MRNSTQFVGIRIHLVQNRAIVSKFLLKMYHFIIIPINVGYIRMIKYCLEIHII